MDGKKFWGGLWYTNTAKTLCLSFLACLKSFSNYQRGGGVYPLKKWGGYNPQEIRGYIDGWMDGMVWYVNNVKMIIILKQYTYGA